MIRLRTCRDLAACDAFIDISSVRTACASSLHQPGRSAARGFVSYGTAKAALAHWTRLAALDLAPHIRVNAIAVGSVATSALEIVLTDDGLRTAMEDTTPLGRIGEPEEIAAAVLFLASAAGGYLTGKVLEVDGGLNVPNLDLGFPDLEPTGP